MIQTGCQTGNRFTTGWTTGCIMYTNIQPVVQPVVSCKRSNTVMLLTVRSFFLHFQFTVRLPHTANKVDQSRPISDGCISV